MSATATVTEVLIYYDGPQLVALTTPDGTPMVGVHVEDVDDDDGGDGSQRWLVAAVSRGDYDAIRGNKLDLRAAFTTARIGQAYIAYDVGADGCAILMEELRGEPPEEWLPDAGCYLRPVTHES